MSTSTPPGSPAPAQPPAAAAPILPQEIKVVSHSILFYWWPVWFFGFLFAIWTAVDGNRMLIVGKESTIVRSKEEGQFAYKVEVKGETKRLLDDSTPSPDSKDIFRPGLVVSPRTWMAPLYLTVVFLIILITSIPLRGLWSLVTIISIGTLSLAFSLFEAWDPILKAMGDLHVFINMAGYLTFGLALFIAWALSVYVFDRRTYMVFTPGQVKVCEEIGGREMVYDTTNLTMEKRRDDWFRHIILGFGSGDLTVKTAGAERHEIVLPNVVFVGSKILAIEQMLRSRQTQPKVG